MPSGAEIVQQLSDADRALYTARLAEAEQALHDVLAGQNVNRLRHGDRDIGFNQANTNDLRDYIAQLRAILDLPVSPLSQLSRTMWRRPRWGM